MGGGGRERERETSTHFHAARPVACFVPNVNNLHLVLHIVRSSEQDSVTFGTLHYDTTDLVDCDIVCGHRKTLNERCITMVGEGGREYFGRISQIYLPPKG